MHCTVAILLRWRPHAASGSVLYAFSLDRSGVGKKPQISLCRQLAAFLYRFGSNSTHIDVLRNVGIGEESVYMYLKRVIEALREGGRGTPWYGRPRVVKRSLHTGRLQESGRRGERRVGQAGRSADQASNVISHAQEIINCQCICSA